MKASTIISTIFLGSLPLLSCGKQGDEPASPATPPDQPDTEKMEIKVSPSATDFEFKNGDQIGLYAVDYIGATPGPLSDAGNHVDNMRFTRSETWKSDRPVYWTDDSTPADLYIYYPYTNIRSAKAVQFDVKADQSAEASYRSSDLMIGKASAVIPAGSTTSIPVGHVMSRVIVSLEAGDGFTAQSLADTKITVKINGVKTCSTVDLSTSTVSASGSASTITPLLSDGAYKAIVVPQSVSECDLITVTADGRDFSLRKAFTFESSEIHKFSVTLSKSSNGLNVNINQWADDGTDYGGSAQ